MVEGSREVLGRDFDASMTWAGTTVWPSVRRILAEATKDRHTIVVTDFVAAYINVELDKV